MSAGAAPLSAATQKRAMEVLNDPSIRSYGSTETIMLAMPRLGRGQADRPGSVGWLLPGIDALLLDPETHKPLDVNNTGPTGPGELVPKAAFITIGGKSWSRCGWTRMGA